MLRLKILKIKYRIITNLVTNTTVITKINEGKNEIPSIINLASTAALNAKINVVKSKISNIENLAIAITLTGIIMNIRYLTIVSISLHQNLTNYQQKMLLQDYQKQIW